jgi:hypothetical protein
MSKLAVAIAFVAGVFGGITSRYLLPQVVHAESYPKELRAQNFVLVNERGSIVGAFSEDEGRPVLRLFDANGREIWSAGGRLHRGSGALGK